VERGSGKVVTEGVVLKKSRGRGLRPKNRETAFCLKEDSVSKNGKDSNEGKE